MQILLPSIKMAVKVEKDNEHKNIFCVSALPDNSHVFGKKCGARCSKNEI
jgi:hypothetical protein